MIKEDMIGKSASHVLFSYFMSCEDEALWLETYKNSLQVAF